MSLGQNLKLRSALQGFAITGNGAYLIGGSAGRIRQWTLSTFTFAMLIRLTDHTTTQIPFSYRTGSNNSGLDIYIGSSVCQTQLYGTSTPNYNLAIDAADDSKDMLFVFANYSATSRQSTINGRRLTTNATNCSVGSAALGIPTIGVRSPSVAAIAGPWLGGIYDIAISYEVALAAADQQAFFEQVVREGGIPSSLNGTRWSHFMRAEDYSGDVSRGQVQLGDRAGGVNWKLPVAANGSPTTLVLSPLRPLVFGPTG